MATRKSQVRTARNSAKTFPGSRRSRRRNSRSPARFVTLRGEQLEVRNVLASQWLAVIGGLAPGDSLNEQSQLGQELLESSGVVAEEAYVVDALDLRGTFVLQTSS